MFLHERTKPEFCTTSSRSDVRLPPGLSMMSLSAFIIIYGLDGTFDYNKHKKGLEKWDTVGSDYIRRHIQRFENIFNISDCKSNLFTKK